MKNTLKRFALVAVALVLLFTTTTSVFAVDKNGCEIKDANGNCLDQQYLDYDIGHYDERKGVCGGDSDTPNPGLPTIEKSDTLEEIFTLLVDPATGGFTAIQAAAIMGNMYAESGFTADAHEAGNDIGYGLVQWSFGRRDSLEAYALATGKDKANVAFQVSYIKKEYDETYKSLLEGTDFETQPSIGKATEAWMNTYEVPALKPADDPARLISKRIPAANIIYGYYKDLAPLVLLGADDDEVCTGGDGVVANDIVQTAINLSLPTPIEDGFTSKEDARDTYQTAKEQFNPAKSNGVPAWSDCGGFVATVMIGSGADPGFPPVGVTTQYNYAVANPDKYYVFEPRSIADLQPGDILNTVSESHTTLYLGVQDSIPGYTSADASLDQRVPSLRSPGSAVWMISNGASVLRLIK